MSSELQDAITKGLEIELATGRRVTLRVIELSRFMERGEIPDELTAIAARELYPEEAKTPEAKVKQYLESLRMAKWITQQVVTAPKSVDDFFDDEFFEVYGLANHPARTLSHFRVQQTRHVDTVLDQQDAGPATEPTPRDH